MASPRYSDIVAFSRAVGRVSDAARRTFETSLTEVDFSDWTRAAKEIRALVDGIMEAYGPAAAELGAQWYEYCRMLKLGKGASATAGAVDLAAVKGAVNADIDMLFEGKVTEIGLTSAVSRTIADQLEKHARDTVLYNLQRDYRSELSSGNRRRAARYGYSRVPEGDACAFCIMLASRGFVYTSKEKAERAQDGDVYHDNCRCVAVPFAEAGDIEGYGAKLAGYEQMYREADIMRRTDSMPQELKDSISAAKSAHDARYAAGETKTPWSPLNSTAMIMRYMNDGLS